ncbi:MAG: hypothetical protein WAU67_09695 [Terracidiphilus sp.]
MSNQGAYYSAESYLNGSSIARKVVGQFDKSGFTVDFVNNGDDHYDPVTKTVSWDPSKAIRDTHGNTISPALALYHEMVHGLGDKANSAAFDRRVNTPAGVFDNREEQRVIQRYENPAARQLHEGIRDSHHGSIYTVFGVDQR